MTHEGPPAAVTDLPATLPSLPRYGENTLADLACSMLASLGVADEPNPLQLPPADRACLLIIDGLGWELLREHPAAAPFLSELAVTGRPLAAGFPATTATSLASLGTGRPPGQHGVLGYQVAVPGEGRLLNALRWDQRVDPEAWQPRSTIFERAADAGISAFRVAHSALGRTGLSVAAMRGAEVLGADTLGALVAEAASALGRSDRALAMVYHGELDATGHVFGSGSDAWRYHLGHVDKLAEQLAGALPPGTALYVVADHGMVDVPPQDRVDADVVPGLRAGVALLGGEPRARHVYARPGAEADVLAAWREILGHRAWVASRDEAIADGWFGPVDPLLAPRIGDVVAAPAGPWAVVATNAEPRESALIGMHGSLTPADQLVPLLALSAM
jgi:predicted AlkP superfamily pyrophosphatase or phosphodiesterase